MKAGRQHSTKDFSHLAGTFSPLISLVLPLVTQLTSFQSVPGLRGGLDLTLASNVLVDCHCLGHKKSRATQIEFTKSSNVLGVWKTGETLDVC